MPPSRSAPASISALISHAGPSTAWCSNVPSALTSAPASRSVGTTCQLSDSRAAFRGVWERSSRAFTPAPAATKALMTAGSGLRAVASCRTSSSRRRPASRQAATVSALAVRKNFWLGQHRFGMLAQPRSVAPRIASVA